MRNDGPSSATCSSHIDRLVNNELERTSQGAPSGPSSWMLKLMPFALIRIAGSPFVDGRRSRVEKILQQPQQRRRRRGRQEIAGLLDQFEAGAGSFLRL